MYWHCLCDRSKLVLSRRINLTTPGTAPPHYTLHALEISPSSNKHIATTNTKMTLCKSSEPNCDCKEIYCNTSLWHNPWYTQQSPPKFHTPFQADHCPPRVRPTSWIVKCCEVVWDHRQVTHLTCILCTPRGRADAWVPLSIGQILTRWGWLQTRKCTLLSTTCHTPPLTSSTSLDILHRLTDLKYECASCTDETVTCGQRIIVSSQTTPLSLSLSRRQATFSNVSV